VIVPLTFLGGVAAGFLVAGAIAAARPGPRCHSCGLRLVPVADVLPLQRWHPPPGSTHYCNAHGGDPVYYRVATPKPPPPPELA
jgi:hypothetical protein